MINPANTASSDLVPRTTTSGRSLSSPSLSTHARAAALAALSWHLTIYVNISSCSAFLRAPSTATAATTATSTAANVPPPRISPL
eukprot:CAMPEP_0185833998 /NCGR_PEP_ID=MMETSP1353-20130828/3750_1 /TAXON_ID=1077150 /ORGANISM="Erythrolobus australicus, Strain CCMP3124" /LENGTH=84 /DNA_ID=CAMNT_0028532343 /DNA_START=209 /DNA_END=463 /DNA_ORIENTATION=-